MKSIFNETRSGLFWLNFFLSFFVKVSQSVCLIRASILPKCLVSGLNHSIQSIMRSTTGKASSPPVLIIWAFYLLRGSRNFYSIQDRSFFVHSHLWFFIRFSETCALLGSPAGDNQKWIICEKDFKNSPSETVFFIHFVDVSFRTFFNKYFTGSRLRFRVFIQFMNSIHSNAWVSTR